MPLPLSRRHTLLHAARLGLALGTGSASPWGHATAQAPSAGRETALASQLPLHFPRDHGSHNAQRTEWWYLTGRLLTPDQRELGFQVTFFRSRVDAAQGLRSRLAARHLLLAHAALTDVSGQRLWHDQRMARWNGLDPAEPPRPEVATPAGTAWASATDTAVVLGDWGLRRTPAPAFTTATTPTHLADRYEAEVNTPEFALRLNASSTQARLLQGQQGLSRKGPEPSQASLYYSQPQLQVQGQVRLGQQTLVVQGRAWLDHEWSEALLHPEAVGWDWVGMNLDDGSSLTAFRLRRANGEALWAGGSWRSAQRVTTTPEQVFGPGDVQMTPLRHWQSPRTGIRYPVEWRLHTPVGEWTVKARTNDQELDSRATTGAVYWEGLSSLHPSAADWALSHPAPAVVNPTTPATPTPPPVGHGYLELTGYGQPLRL